MSSQTRILVTGYGGQLGSSLKKLTVTGSADGVEIIGVTRSELDVSNRSEFSQVVSAVKPQVVLNAAAYTAVDAAESDPETAMMVNGHAVRKMAEVCLDEDIRFVHISTDFVFGAGHKSPIQVDAEPDPQSVYGRSKLAGEQACLEVLGSKGLIIRTSWLYANGHSNFVNTMIGLMRTRDSIGVVDDQVGCPTWGHGLAERVVHLIKLNASGIFHLKDGGHATWYEFAQTIRDLACRHGIISDTCEVRPISTADYPTPAVRPHYSVLDGSRADLLVGYPAPDWRSNLAVCMSEWTSL